MRPLLAVDPGLNSLGYAYWDETQKPDQPPHTVGLLHAPRKLLLPERCRWLAEGLRRVTMSTGQITVRGKHIDKLRLVSEYPSYFGGQSIRGWAKGDLQKLTFLVGVLAGYFSPLEFTEVTPGDWKGQLPKDVVIRRLQKRFGPGATKEWEKDAWDAVGIGLWKLGRF